MTKIEVYGHGVSFSLAEITPELAKELTETGVTYEKFDELEVTELEDTDEDECGITSELEVHVDGQKIANPHEGDFGVEHEKDVRSYKLGEPGKWTSGSSAARRTLWDTKRQAERRRAARSRWVFTTLGTSCPPSP